MEKNVLTALWTKIKTVFATKESVDAALSEKMSLEKVNELPQEMDENVVYSVQENESIVNPQDVELWAWKVPESGNLDNVIAYVDISGGTQELEILFNTFNASHDPELDGQNGTMDLYAGNKLHLSCGTNDYYVTEISDGYDNTLWSGYLQLGNDFIIGQDSLETSSLTFKLCDEKRESSYNGDFVSRKSEKYELVTAKDVNGLANITPKKNTLYHVTEAPEYVTYETKTWGIDRIKIKDDKLRYKFGDCVLSFDDDVEKSGETTYINPQKLVLESLQTSTINNKDFPIVVHGNDAIQVGFRKGTATHIPTYDTMNDSFELYAGNKIVVSGESEKEFFLTKIATSYGEVLWEGYESTDADSPTATIQQFTDPSSLYFYICEGKETDPSTGNHRLTCQTIIAKAKHPIRSITFNCHTTDREYFDANVGTLTTDLTTGAYTWNCGDKNIFEVIFTAIGRYEAENGVDNFVVTCEKLPEQKRLYVLNNGGISPSGYKQRLDVEAVKLRNVSIYEDDDMETYLMEGGSGYFDIKLNGALSDDEKIVLVFKEKYTDRTPFTLPCEFYNLAQGNYDEIRQDYSEYYDSGYIAPTNVDFLSMQPGECDGSEIEADGWCITPADYNGYIPYIDSDRQLVMDDGGEILFESDHPIDTISMNISFYRATPSDSIEGDFEIVKEEVFPDNDARLTIRPSEKATSLTIYFTDKIIIDSFTLSVEQQTPHFIPNTVINSDEHGFIDYNNTSSIINAYSVVPLISIEKLEGDNNVSPISKNWFIKYDEDVYGGQKRGLWKGGFDVLQIPLVYGMLSDNSNSNGSTSWKNVKYPLTFDAVFLSLMSYYRLRDFNRQDGINPFFGNVPYGVFLKRNGDGVHAEPLQKLFGFAIWNKNTNQISEVSPFLICSSLKSDIFDAQVYSEMNYYSRARRIEYCVWNDRGDINIHCKKKTLLSL